uniref:Receptor-type tyrosine-protein phosphatase eta n=1 Tax=Schistocephalus solidus TaxID=70667 RepID=A0A0X3Q5S4_SCHSO
MPCPHVVGIASFLFLVHVWLGFLDPAVAGVLPMMSLKSVIDVSPTSISVTWNEVNVTNALYLAKATADNAVKSNCSCRVPCSGCKLEGLRAGTTYNVRLEICNEYTCTSSSETIEETTVPGLPGPPTNVSVVLQSPTQVKIQWDPPEVTNGQIANYTALILQPFLFKCSFRGSENASCIIYDMYEGLTYDVFVYACNYAHSNGRGGGCGQNSSIKTFKTWTGYLDNEIMEKLTPHLGRLPELQETTQAMIILPLSALRLDVSGPLLKATLFVHSGHISLKSQGNMSFELAYHEIKMLKNLKQEFENSLVNPIGSTYRNNTNGSWEVLVINEWSKALPSLPDKHFILGDGLGRPKISHLYNGPLYPDTPYTVQLRLYLQEAYFTSAPIIFSTRASPVAPLIIFASFGAVGLLGLLGFCIYLARRRTGQYAMLVSEARDGETEEEEDSAMQTNEFFNSESDSAKHSAFRHVKVKYLRRPAMGSYENQRIQPISIEKFSDYVTRLLESPNGHINVQFRLLNILARQQEQYCGLTTCLGDQFSSMTLHPDCPPYDQTVVVLDQSWAAYRMVRRTVLPHARHYATVYIDASYVTRCDFNQKKGVAIVPEFGNVPAFIAASTPMENTCPQFLTMIAQQRCPLVINLDE